MPRLVEFDESLLVIEIDVVTPPYLLDFGKAHLDHKPDFSEEVLADWEESLVEYFGEDVPLVKSALWQLRKFGIYYLDAKPGNIRLRKD